MNKRAPPSAIRRRLRALRSIEAGQGEDGRDDAFPIVEAVRRHGVARGLVGHSGEGVGNRRPSRPGPGHLDLRYGECLVTLDEDEVESGELAADEVLERLVPDFPPD